MSPVESSVARQRVLWRVGALLSEARLADVDEVIVRALARVGRALGVDAIATYRTDLVDRVTTQSHVWMSPDAPDELHDAEVRAAGDNVVAEMFANEGVAVFPITELAGERTIAPGWENGVGLLALIDWADDVAHTIAVLTPDAEFDDDDVDFIRGFATTLRQFFARVRIERDLQQRLDLEDLVASSVSRLAAATADRFSEVTAVTLDELCGRLRVDMASFLRISPDRVVSEHSSGDRLPEIWDDFRPVGDGRFVNDDLSPSFYPVSTLAAAFFGDAPSGVAEDDDRQFALFPANVGENSRTCLALLSGPRAWSSAELDAITTIGTTVGQTRARLEAERWSNYRAGVQAEFSTVAANFLRAREDDVDEIIHESLGRVARQLEASAVIVLDLEGQPHGHGAVLHSWLDGGAPFDHGEVIRHPTGWEDSLELLEPRSSVLPLSPRMKPELRALVDDGSGVFTLVSMPLMSMPGSTAAIGVAFAGDHDEHMSMLSELVATFADLLSQLRSRIALEVAETHRASTQQFLRGAAATLAEAAEADFEDAVTEVLERAAEFLDLDELSTWHVDRDTGRFLVRRTIGGAEGLGASVPFGVDPVMDEALASSDIAAHEDRLGDGVVASSLAFPRGDDPVTTLLVACRTGAAPLCEHERAVLGELNRLLGQIEERIAGERYSHTAFGSAPIGIVLCDQDWRIITCNPAFAGFVGHADPADLVGVAPEILLDTDERDPFGGTHELPLRRVDGRRIWTLCHSTAIEGVLTGEPMWLVHVEDITERRRADQLLRFQANHDELTGLANRRQLRTLCEERLNGAGSTAVLLLDLDRFKLINDSLGHDRGDDLLVAIADRLRLAVRPGDVVARLGGDEFAVLLPGPVDNFEAGRLADRLLRLLGEPMTLGSQQVFPSASIGIAVADDDSTVADMLRRADTAMYRAKAGGRSRHEAFDEDLRDEVRARMETEAGLRQALREGELRVHYQPEVSLHTGRTLGAEALVRWEHPTRGLLLPGAFMEVAEETGLIIDIGTHVLFEACSEAAGWDDRELAVRVNFAPAQLQRRETIALVEMALAQSGLEPHRLCVEITETAMMADLEQAEAVLLELKRLGVRVAVDDFGTGFSSLAYLKRFPVDALKIDRAFVSDLGAHDEDNAFVRSILSLAEALGLSVVAEGVETEEQVDTLLRLGCHRAQGFYFARPRPAADLRSRLAAELTG